MAACCLAYRSPPARLRCTGYRHQWRARAAERGPDRQPGAGDRVIQHGRAQLSVGAGWAWLLQGGATLAAERPPGSQSPLQGPGSLTHLPRISNPGAAVGAAGGKLPACGGRAAVRQAGVQGAAGEELLCCSCSQARKGACAECPQQRSRMAAAARRPLLGACRRVGLIAGQMPCVGAPPTAARLGLARVQLTRTAGGGLKRTPSWHSFGTTLDETDTEEEADGTSVVRPAAGSGGSCCRAAAGLLPPALPPLLLPP